MKHEVHCPKQAHEHTYYTDGTPKDSRDEVWYEPESGYMHDGTRIITPDRDFDCTPVQTLVAWMQADLTEDELADWHDEMHISDADGEHYLNMVAVRKGIPAPPL